MTTPGSDTSKPSFTATLRRFAVMWLYATVLLLLISWDSYCYDLWAHYDTNWFFTCGKAWMNGMVPYVDFTDSKGPLLWLIYGVGYLISPHNFVGTFWISTVVFAAIFHCCYAIAALHLRHRGLRMLAVVVVSVFLTNGFVHDEVRAEDYCQLFVAPVLYMAAKHIHGDNSTRLAARAAFTLGLALAGTLLIKYSFTLMLAVFIPYFAVTVPRRCHLPVARALGAMTLGAATLLMPFVVWFAVLGNLDDFIHEYFFVTATTLHNLRGDKLSTASLLEVVLKKSIILYVLALAAGVALYVKRRHGAGKFLLLALLWFLAATLPNGKTWFYFSSMALFSVFGITALLQPAQQRLAAWWAQLALAAAVLFPYSFTVTSATNSWYSHDSFHGHRYYYYAGILSQVDHPRVLFWAMHDKGYGIPVDALPACKYWAQQEGATPAMKQMQWETVRERRCDFVFVDEDDTALTHKLDSLGYQRFDFFKSREGLTPAMTTGHTLLYSARPLREMTTRVTSRDILFKHDIHPQPVQ